MKKTLVSALVLCAVSAPALADVPACQANFKQEGSWLAGRTFTTHGEVAGVARADAFRRIYAGAMKGGLQVSHADKEMGAITAQMPSSFQGKQISIPLGILVEPAGKGSKLSITMQTPGGYSISGEGVQRMLCSVFDDAAH